MKKSGGELLRLLTNPLFIGVLFSLDVIIIRIYLYSKFEWFFVDDAKLIENFIEWFGVAYGLFIALVLVNVWSQFNDTEREFDKEADAVFALFQSLNQLDASKTKINRLKIISIGLIKEYVDHVINNFNLEHQKIDVRDKGDLMIFNLRDKIGDIVHSNEKEAITFELAKEFNDVIDARGDRISHAKQRIPEPVWQISLWSSILWLLPFLGLGFQQPWLAFILEGGVAVIVIAILAIIKDLDDPFEGTWKIDKKEWDILAERIGMLQRVILVYKLNNTPFNRLWFRVNTFSSIKPCALYSLIRSSAHKEMLRSQLSKTISIHILFKDQYESLYEKQQIFPTVLYKSNNILKEIINSDEIKNLKTHQELINLIEQRI